VHYITRKHTADGVHFIQLQQRRLCAIYGLCVCEPDNH